MRAFGTNILSTFETNITSQSPMYKQLPHLRVLILKYTVYPSTNQVSYQYKTMT